MILFAFTIVKARAIFELERRRQILFSTYRRECKRKFDKGVQDMETEPASESDEIRFQNVVGMGLDFSSMISLPSTNGTGKNIQHTSMRPLCPPETIG